ncbi:MAG TPA: MFS transporter [Acetobacteraceae bacterium]|jgi:MFS family permease|nr:MFS transporter [Acetobacteraceae bacterium]
MRAFARHDKEAKLLQNMGEIRAMVGVDMLGGATGAERQMLRRVIFASVLGNGLEWFDFMSYGYFASIIAKVFFPAHSSLSLLLTYATFAVGFVVRPIGGIVLGAYADKFGRRRSLALLIAMMAFGTLTIGVTPSYTTIGIAAPIIVVIGRVVQGFSIGGEFANATALLVEYAPKNRRMTFGSFQLSSQGVGQVLATTIGLAVITTLPAATVHAWAWRLPFLIGALVGPFGFYIRYRLVESPEYQELRTHVGTVAQAPLRNVLRGHAMQLLCGIGIVIIGTALTYIWATYLPVYVVRQLHLPLWQGLMGVLAGSVIGIAACVLGGRLGDRFGPYRMFFIFTVISALLSYPLFLYVLAAPSLARLIEVQLLALTVLALLHGSTPGMLAGLFPVEVRTTGMAITYNLSVTVFGGFAPLTVSWLIAETGNKTMPAFYLMTAAALSLLMVGSTIATVQRRARIAILV